MYKFEYRKYRKGWQNTRIHTFRSMGVRTHHAEGQMASIKRLQTITKEEFRQRKQTGMTNLYYFLALTKVVKVNHTGECNVQACRYFSERFGRGCRENILYNTLIHKNLMEIYKKKISIIPLKIMPYYSVSLKYALNYIARENGIIELGSADFYQGFGICSGSHYFLSAIFLKIFCALYFVQTSYLSAGKDLDISSLFFI